MNYNLTLIVILFAYMNFWFGVSLIKNRNNVADVGWGLGFVLMTWVSFFLSYAYGKTYHTHQRMFGV